MVAGLNIYAVLVIKTVPERTSLPSSEGFYLAEKTEGLVNPTVIFLDFYI
jgi:hypothetical protein